MSDFPTDFMDVDFHFQSGFQLLIVLRVLRFDHGLKLVVN